MSYIDKLINSLQLDLEGLTVITEAASHEYQLMPIIAAKAGAKVVALGKDTSYGKYLAIKNEIEQKANQYRIHNKLEVKRLDNFDNWSNADIITNSGMLRPITKEKISKFKKTAVIPLLWETWEFRPNEIDILSCQNYNIPLIGTNENFSKIDMFMYPGMLAIYLLNKEKIDYSTEEIAFFGGGLTGTLIVNHISKLNDSILWFCDSHRKDLTEQIPVKYDQHNLLYEKENLRVIFISEHSDPINLVGDNGLINIKKLKKKFPNLILIHLCGNIDIKHLIDSKIKVIPSQIAKFGYMSVLPNVFGEIPMIKLFAAGLKVGEIAAKERLSGASVEKAIQKTIDYGIGQDFEEGFFNYKI